MFPQVLLEDQNRRDFASSRKYIHTPLAFRQYQCVNSLREKNLAFSVRIMFLGNKSQYALLLMMARETMSLSTSALGVKDDLKSDCVFLAAVHFAFFPFIVLPYSSTFSMLPVPFHELASAIKNTIPNMNLSRLSFIAAALSYASTLPVWDQRGVLLMISFWDNFKCLQHIQSSMHTLNLPENTCRAAIKE